MTNKLLIIIYILVVTIISYFVPIWYLYIPVLIGLSILFSKKETPAFLYGFISVFMVWFLMMLLIDVKNDALLSQKIAVLFKLPSKWLLILLTSIIGSILGGLASLLGKNIKSSFGYIN